MLTLFRFEISEIVVFHGAFRKVGDEDQLTSHRFDMRTKAGDVHIRTAFDLGDARLLDA